MKREALLFLSFFLLSCTAASKSVQPKPLSSNPKFTKVSSTPEAELVPATPVVVVKKAKPLDPERLKGSLESSFQNLPPHLLERVDNSFLQNIKDVTAMQHVLTQLEQQPEAFPIIPSTQLFFRYTSRYDSFPLEYSVRAPEEPRESSSLFLLLGDSDLYKEDYSKTGAWVVTIPSRPNMNYQLLAEGDFWLLVDELLTVYPHLKQFPKYLVGIGKTADAALLFANHYRGSFSGIAFSASRLGLDLPNLDKFPVVHFSSKQDSFASPWGGNKLIKRLQARGNAHAVAINGGLSKAINLLKEQQIDNSRIEPYTFEDYQHAEVNSWLKVLTKRTEKDPVKLSALVDDQELIINAPNVTGVEITRSKLLGFPEGVKKIRLNHTSFPLPDSSQIKVKFLEEEGSYWKSKIQVPGGLLNFFRNERVYIVYQDSNATDDYLREASQLAQTFSTLAFYGFPTLNAKLPVIPLSKYHPKALPPHRTILIGKSSYLEPVLEESANYLPVDDKEGTAYGLIYPPEKTMPLKLAFLLASDDQEGLQTLSRRYISATALFDDADLAVWMRVDDEYNLIKEETFNSFWKPTSPSSLLIVTPPSRNAVWERYLQELIIEESGTPNLAITSCIDTQLTLPSRITFADLERVVPNKYLASLNLKGYLGRALKNKLIAAMDDPTPLQIDNTVFETDDEVRIVVDASVLGELSKEEISLLDYQILPYSCKELLLRKIEQERGLFSRDFLRIANLVEEESQTDEEQSFTNGDM